MKVETIQLYDNREDVTLTTYVLDDSRELLNGGKRPAILVCPGGAYLFCSDREGEAVALRFAAMGYHAFVLRYSVYNGGKMPEPNEELKVDKNSIYPNAMLDIGAAMLKIRERSKEWFVDENQIFLCGFSAGAHNCAMYSVYWNRTLFQEHFEKPVSEFKPAAAVLGYGYYDYYKLRREQTLSELDKKMGEAIDMSFFGTVNPSEEQLKEASPALQVTEQTPPMYLWATTGDNTLSVQQSLEMANALAEKKVPFEIHVFEEGDHGLVLGDQATASMPEQIQRDVAKWVEMAQCWLEKHVPVQIPEKPAMGNPFAE